MVSPAAALALLAARLMGFMRIGMTDLEMFNPDFASLRSADNIPQSSPLPSPNEHETTVTGDIPAAVKSSSPFCPNRTASRMWSVDGHQGFYRTSYMTVKQIYVTCPAMEGNILE